MTDRINSNKSKNEGLNINISKSNSFLFNEIMRILIVIKKNK